MGRNRSLKRTPLADLPEDVQEEVRWALDSDRPPLKYKYFGFAEDSRPVAAIVSRAWYEWHKRHQKQRKLVRRQRIIDRDGMLCGICKRAIDCLRDLHIDHIIPLSRGGSSQPNNLQPAHRLCNLKKGASIP